jgi:hypothetical protein
MNCPDAKGTETNRKKPDIPLIDASAFKKAAKEVEGGDQDKLPF